MSPQRKRSGLGQGLDALIRSSAGGGTAGSEGGGLRMVAVDSILPNPFQPRSQMEESRLEELAASIREHGVIQPLIVTQMEDGAVGERFRLIAGERRWRAAKRVGLAEIPVVVREATERQMLELAIIENIQRQDLNPIEEALAYQQMGESSQLTQGEIADRVGKSRSAVANTMSLLRLPEPIQEMVRDERLSEGHARALKAIESASDMRALADRVIERGLNVRQTEELVRRVRMNPTSREPERMSLQDRELQRAFSGALGTRVELRRRKRGGQLVLHFDDEEDLQALYDRLVGE